MSTQHIRDQQTLPHVFAEFMLIDERTDLGLFVPVVPEANVTLIEGERVILTDFTDLWAEGTVTAIEQDGGRYWYGKLNSRADIHDTGEMAIPTYLPPQRQAASTP